MVVSFLNGVVLPGEGAGSDRGVWCVTRKVKRKIDVRLPGRRNSDSHGARPVHLIVSMKKWIRTSGLSIIKELSLCGRCRDEGSVVSVGVVISRPLVCGGGGR